MNLVASCAFGLEAVVARELSGLGYATKTSGPGQVTFQGDWSAIAKANLWLRSADRISIVIAEFDCSDFDTLFETAKTIDWESFLAEDANIHVTGGSVKSQLTSVPAIQRTVKKAIVMRLLGETPDQQLDESGALYRVHVAFRNDRVRLTLDTTGASLHKRGYREIATKAPLKETLAAALVQLSFWTAERPLMDPFCGGGTILIEAALLARNMAPGLKRKFACEDWPNAPAECWRQERESAASVQRKSLPNKLMGTDIHSGALSLARRNATLAGVADDIHFQQQAFDRLSSRREFGCIITNPPYGDRLDAKEIRRLYESIPLVLKDLPTWSHFVLTAYPRFEALIGRPADRRRKLYNGRIECTYFQFHGPRPGETTRHAQHPDAAAGTTQRQPVFGGSSPKDAEQAGILKNRLRKRARHLRRWPRRGVTCYRIYERDIPEIPLVIDRYEDHLHIVEYERPHDRDLARHMNWLELMRLTAAEALEVDLDRVVLKTRTRQKGLAQHDKLDNVGREILVQEAGLEFLVNLTDYQDTGLFLDHRAARAMIGEMSQGQRVLNLFAYTGAFSVYAAAGGATEVTTVDWSPTYIDWAKRNFAANHLSGPQYRFIKSDTRSYVRSLDADAAYDLIICDPPTFSNSKRTDEVWDVQQDHAELLNALLRHLSPDGTIFFSSNFRRLKFNESALNAGSVREITKRTIPEDFRNQRVHRSWLIRLADSPK